MLFIEADEKQGKECVTLEYSNFMATKWNGEKERVGLLAPLLILSFFDALLYYRHCL